MTVSAIVKTAEETAKSVVTVKNAEYSETDRRLDRFLRANLRAMR